MLFFFNQNTYSRVLISIKIGEHLAKSVEKLISKTPVLDYIHYNK